MTSATNANLEKWQECLRDLGLSGFIRKQDLGLGKDSIYHALKTRGFAKEEIRYISDDESLLPAGEKYKGAEKCMVLIITEAGREEATRLMSNGN